MLRVVHSNRSAALAEALAESIGPRPDPFAPLKVVVAGRLVERWLMRRLAQRHGIAAGIDWMSFESMLVSAYAGDEAGRANRLYAIDRHSLPVALTSVLAGVGKRESADLLGELTGASPTLGAASSPLGPVRAYLASDDPLDVARRVQLAERLADLYWSYGLSRPQWLMAWQRRQTIPEHQGDPAAAWQAELWAQLVEHVSGTGGSASTVGPGSAEEDAALFGGARARRRRGGRWRSLRCCPRCAASSACRRRAPVAWR